MNASDHALAALAHERRGQWASAAYHFALAGMTERAAKCLEMADTEAEKVRDAIADIRRVIDATDSSEVTRRCRSCGHPVEDIRPDDYCVGCAAFRNME